MTKDHTKGKKKIKKVKKREDMRIKRDPNSMGLVGIDFGGRWVIRFEEAKKIG